MMSSPAGLDAALLFLALLAFLAALLAARDVTAPHELRVAPLDGVPDLLGATGLAAAGAMALSPEPMRVLPVAALALLVAVLLRQFARRLSMAGVIWLSVEFLSLPFALAWSWRFLDAAPGWTRPPLIAGFAVGGLAMLLGRIERIAREAVVTHAQWRRPTAAPSAPSRHAARPKVSIHLCCYAEPPAVVIATIDRLAALDYPDYEVLVCDNNTADEALWRPLEAHCAALNARVGPNRNGGERFRFFHVAPLAGAKAGALNFCLGQTAADAELVAVIDADYLARGDFLARLVPFFDDPAIGYLQTPHDYRDWAGSDYLTSCYWEYMPTNKVDYPGVSEYGGAFTIGTMCLLRTAGLRAVGGWAEWCLTEDSEVSVRLRAIGLDGMYLGETFGRGLIPETFDDYKKQRFRWTAGPVQQLRRHWRLFLPSPLAPPMPGWTKLLEVLRCVTPLQSLAAVVTMLCGIAALLLAFVTGVGVPGEVPEVVWLVMAASTATLLVRGWHRYRLAGCTSKVDMIHGEIARMSLTWVVLVAGIAGLSKRPLAWRRTPKFALTEKASAWEAARTETILGAICLLLMLAVVADSSTLGRGVALLTLLVLAGLALHFFAATHMAYLARGHAQAIVEDGAGRPVRRFRLLRSS
jgi:hypothetical protein